MAEFMLVAMDQVVNEANRFHYMTTGQVKVPVVLKAGYGFTAGWAGQHTGTIYGMFMGVPGLKVGAARDCRRREGPDDTRRSATTTRSSSSTTTCSRSNTATSPRASTSCRSGRRTSSARAVT